MEIVAPKLGLTVETMEIVRWRKAVGERVVVGEVVVELAADKSDVELEAQVDGVLEAIVAADGDVVTPGQVLGRVVADAVPASPAARRLARELGVGLAGIAGSGPGGRIVEGDVRRSHQAGPPPAVTGIAAAAVETPGAGELVGERGLGPGLDEVEATARALLVDVPDGRGLEPVLATLVGLAVAASPTTLDRDGIERAAACALALGVPVEQLTETVVLASALGAHGLHEGALVLTRLLERTGAAPPLTDAAAARRQRLLADPYWRRLDEEIPGRIEAVLRLSPAAFEAFVESAAVPWRTGTLPAKAKELIYVAIDATPSHRYLPGLRFHVRNAVDLGATRNEVLEVIAIAAAAGPARGIAD